MTIRQAINSIEEKKFILILDSKRMVDVFALDSNIYISIDWWR